MEYAPRYLAGVVLFNEQDYFEAHEVWEELWAASSGDERRFYQGLIQAAVGLCHYGNGNLRGAVKLYQTSRKYMEGLPRVFLGLDTQEFWQQMAHCFAPVLEPTAADSPALDESRLPVIRLDPPPLTWPDPQDFVAQDD